METRVLFTEAPPRKVKSPLKISGLRGVYYDLGFGRKHRLTHISKFPRKTTHTFGSPWPRLPPILDRTPHPPIPLPQNYLHAVYSIDTTLAFLALGGTETEEG